MLPIRTSIDKMAIPRTEEIATRMRVDVRDDDRGHVIKLIVQKLLGIGHGIVRGSAPGLVTVEGLAHERGGATGQGREHLEIDADLAVGQRKELPDRVHAEVTVMKSILAARKS